MKKLIRSIKSKTISRILPAAFFALALCTCNNPLQSPDKTVNSVQPDGSGNREKATVTVSIRNTGARTVLPNVGIESIAYCKLLGGITGTPETKLAEFQPNGNGEKAISLELTTGDWNFTLDAYDSSGNHILQGKLEKTAITAEVPNNLDFRPFPLNSGTGAIEIKFTFPETAGISGINLSGELGDGSYTIQNTAKEFTYTDEEVDASEYFITFKFYDNASNCLLVYSELVVVRSNLTSAKEINLAKYFPITFSDTASLAAWLSGVQGNYADTPYEIAMQMHLGIMTATGP